MSDGTITVASPNRSQVTVLSRERGVIIAAARQGPAGPSGDIVDRQQSLTPTQTTWTLTETPTEPHFSRFYLNGQKQRYLVDYSIDGPIVTWSSVPLVVTDYLEINYR